MAENKQNRSRRDFLKRLGWGGASAVGMMAMAPLRGRDSRPSQDGHS